MNLEHLAEAGRRNVREREHRLAGHEEGTVVGENLADSAAEASFPVVAVDYDDDFAGLAAYVRHEAGAGITGSNNGHNRCCDAEQAD